MISTWTFVTAAVIALERMGTDAAGELYIRSQSLIHRLTANRNRRALGRVGQQSNIWVHTDQLESVPVWQK